ncbi:MAG: FtsW/RodA/SpoVE family cell cycle protein [Clostridia bacterium]|nr:FtsW/RodA/SpoVE family cell cycle protein [Clostridia bacterium]
MRFFDSIKNFLKETDFSLLIPCMLLSSFGILMVHSATLRTVSEGSIFARDVIVMIAAVGFGIVLSLIISLFDYEFIIRLWPGIAGVALLLMLALFKWGDSPQGRDDAFSWLYIKPLKINIQPSEILKIAFIITFSMHIDMQKDKINEPKTMLFLLIHAFIPTGLVIVTGDLGSALVFVIIFVGLLFVSGVYLRYFAAAISLILAASPVLWMFFFSTFQKERFLAIYYPQALDEYNYEKNIFQQKQGLNAIGSGGLTGSGLFEGYYTQRGIVPESNNDMIFSVVCEELGLLGGLLMLGLMAFIVLRIVLVAKNTHDGVSKLLCWGVAFMLSGQIFINIGMCLKLLPVIGITLPFMSAGGSSNLSVYLALGLVFSVYRFNKTRAPMDFRLGHVYIPFRD